MHSFLRHRLPAALAGALTACLAGGGIVWASGAAAGAAGSAAAVTNVTVNCAHGQKIGKALDGLPPGQTAVTINFTGTCIEDVVINRDDVTLHAVPPAAIQTPPAAATTGTTLRVVDAQGVQLHQVRIVGGGQGMEIDNSQVTASGVTITGSIGGLLLDFGSEVTWDGGTITQTGNDGADINNGSYFVSNDSVFTENKNDGIGIQGGRAQLIGCQLTNNGDNGVSVGSNGSAFVGQCTIEHNANDGVASGESSNADVYGGDLSWNTNGIVVTGGEATLGTTITHNSNGVTGLTGARITIAGGTVIEDNDGEGLWLMNGSIAEIDGNDTMANNGQDGISLSDNSSIAIDGGDNVVTGNKSWDVRCQESPAVPLIEGSVADLGDNAKVDTNCMFVPD